MDVRTLKSDAILLFTAVIWGFAFVAQRIGMEHVGPFTYNAVRFALGSLSLIPLLLLSRIQEAKYAKILPQPTRRTVITGSVLAGLALFMGSSLQQIGLVYTTAGKAGFITGLYVVLVPIVGVFWKQRTAVGTWVGAMFAVVGLYLLSVTESLTISRGDLLVLLSAFFWAGHLHVIGMFSARIGSIKLAFIQFSACSVLSLLMAAATELISPAAILRAAIPIMYGGFLSVGVAFTLQVVAQRDANTSHAAIIMSLEVVFAALGGWMILGETLSPRGLTGCAVMLAGMLVSQLNLNIDFLTRNGRTPAGRSLSGKPATYEATKTR
jgi:drug/metabolite transporter (DMT)-like permease